MDFVKIVTFFVIIIAIFIAILLFNQNNELYFEFFDSVTELEEILIPQSKKLEVIPSEVKSIYATVWTASSNKSMDRVINLIKTTDLNSVIIDIKDYTGRLPFIPQSSSLNDMGVGKEMITDLPDLIDRLHEENIYVIARIAVFQDVFLAEKKEEWAIKDGKTGKVWRDRNDLAWVDPASKEVWEYILEIAKETDNLGFDELNFDYIRFPSDGDLDNLSFPFYDGVTLKTEVMRGFYSFLSDNLRKDGIIISADIFGQATFDRGGLGIGQYLEYIAPYFDFICPMVYPSHYANGFNGFDNPAEHPYEIVKYSLDKARQRLFAYQEKELKDNSTSTSLITKKDIDEAVEKGIISEVAKIRPWLQDFDMGADYDEEKVRAQIKATEDSQTGVGWFLWDPRNIYTASALVDI